jgi:SAM-dependent methyltransferase
VGARDRSLRFVFDTVADAYVSGRPELPLQVVLEAASAVGMPARARVLEVGAGGGQLTHALVEAGFRVVALEPGDALRGRAARRAPAAAFLSATFEKYEPDGRFDAVFASNAFHWVDPDVGYAKAADIAAAVVLVWDTAFIADAGLRRRVQGGVINPRGGTFPIEEEDIREFVGGELRSLRGELVESGRFEEPWTSTHERRLTYTPERYVQLIGSMGQIAASSGRADLLAELRPALGEEPFELVDLVWTIAARSR